MPVYFYLIEKQILINYHKHKEKIYDYEEKLINTYKEYLDFIATDEDLYKDKLTRFQLLIDHTDFHKPELIEIGYESSNSFEFIKSSKEIEKFLNDGYVIVDEYWRESLNFYDSHLSLKINSNQA
jgi:hypothetical protein